MNAAPIPMVSKANAASSEGIILVSLLSLVFSAVASTSLYFYRMNHPETFSQLPPVTYTQCLSLAIASILSLVFFAFHMTLQLRLVALNMPIVPSSIPFFGHAFRFIVQTPWDSMLQWHQQVGEIFSFTLMGRTMVSLSNPEHLKLALQSKISAVKKDVGFTYQPFLVILGKGIVTSEDKDWMHQRLKMSTALRITVLDIIPRVTLKAVQRLMIKFDAASETGEPVELTESLRHLTLQVISNTFLSISFDESDSTFGKLYLPIVDECNTRVWHPYRAACFFLPFWWKHLNRVRLLNSYVSNLIQNRWNNRQATGTRLDDILDLVLDSYEKGHPQQTVIPAHAVRQIRDEFKTFMLAGHETSASMMTWALYEMMANQPLMKEVATESEAIFGKNKDWSANGSLDLPPREEYAGLICAEACLKVSLIVRKGLCPSGLLPPTIVFHSQESLRKYSVVPLVIRKVVSLLDLGDYQIPKGSTLAINIQAVHHNPKYWPNPMTFDPHRFIDQRPAPWTFLPFLEGPRNCLGQHLSLLESKIVLALLTQRYEFGAQGEIMTELGRSSTDPRHQYIIPVTPKEELNVTVKKRF